MNSETNAVIFHNQIVYVICIKESGEYLKAAFFYH